MIPTSSLDASSIARPHSSPLSLGRTYTPQVSASVSGIGRSPPVPQLRCPHIVWALSGTNACLPVYPLHEVFARRARKPNVLLPAQRACRRRYGGARNRHVRRSTTASDWLAGDLLDAQTPVHGCSHGANRRRPRRLASAGRNLKSWTEPSCGHGIEHYEDRLTRCPVPARPPAILFRRATTIGSTHRCRGARNHDPWRACRLRDRRSAQFRRDSGAIPARFLLLLEMLPSSSSYVSVNGCVSSASKEKDSGVAAEPLCGQSRAGRR